MILDIQHETRYRYDTGAEYVIQQLRLTPREEAGQRVRSWHIDAPGRLRAHTDSYGNRVHVLTLESPKPELCLRVHGRVETAADPVPMPAGMLNPAVYTAPTALTQASPELLHLGRTCLTGPGDNLGRLFDLMGAIHQHIRYLPGSTHAGTTAGEALAQGCGVCQDQAHAFVAACRAARVPARYVSGYLLASENEHIATHAWADAWLDGIGWMSFDITHNRLANDALCRLAVGRDYLDASPLRGVRRGGGLETMQVFVQVAMAQQ